jgi:hypothetical protein
MGAMPDPEPPRLNKHGQEIWFKQAESEGSYVADHPKGWIMVSAGVSAVMVVLWAFTDLPLLVAFVAPFVVAAPGLLWLAITVRHHS